MLVIDESVGMKLEYENFAEILSRPKVEKKPGEAFTRNFQKSDRDDQDGFEGR